MKTTTTFYSLHPTGSFNITSLEEAIAKKWKRTFLRNPIIVYESTERRPSHDNVKKRTFDPKYGTSEFDSEIFTEISIAEPDTQRRHSYAKS